ncbi:MAG: hypothetical protein AMJ66_05840 [Betaproteobacteria bacterium SG8_40]|nr:MAG: hypothetical protein AMJ66_05840 [Betaproteobacteria bacterium SG8_40]
MIFGYLALSQMIVFRMVLDLIALMVSTLGRGDLDVVSPVPVGGGGFPVPLAVTASMKEN